MLVMWYLHQDVHSAKFIIYCLLLEAVCAIVQVEGMDPIVLVSPNSLGFSFQL